MGTAFLYGNGGSGGTGATLTVTAPSGCTVTISKDGKTKTKTAGADGVAVFKGLKSGQWTVTITDGEQTAQKSVTITADYATAITFFAATIHVTYPAGAVCTATDGVTTLTAPDTSGTWDCVVQNAGTWEIKIDDYLFDSVQVGENGHEFTLNKWYLVKNGDVCQYFTGGWNVIGDNIGSYEIATDGLYAVHGSLDGSRYVCWITKNKVDLTNIKSIHAYGKATYNPSYMTLMLSITDNANGYYWGDQLSYNSKQNETEAELILDVSGYSGEHYVRLMHQSNTGAKSWWNDVYMEVSDS